MQLSVPVCVCIGGLWELYPTPFSVFRYYDMRCNCARFRSLRSVNNCTNSNHPMARLLTVYVCTYVAFRRHARCSRKCVTFRAASRRHLNRANINRDTYRKMKESGFRDEMTVYVTREPSYRGLIVLGFAFSTANPWLLGAFDQHTWVHGQTRAATNGHLNVYSKCFTRAWSA